MHHPPPHSPAAPALSGRRAGPAVPRSYGYIFPLAGILLLLASCIQVSSHRIFWFDELCTYYPATDPSLLHMLRGQADLINSAPPVYGLLIWSWAHVFGGSELSLRLATSLGFASALLVLFRLLRGSFGTFPAGFATLTWFTASTMIMLQNFEARSYGLFVVELTLVATAYHALLTAPVVTRRITAAVIATSALFILTHYLALFYGSALIAAALAHEWLTGRRAWRRVLVIPLGYLAIVPWLPIYFRHTEFSRPHGWIRETYLPDLLAGLNLGVPALGLVGLTLAAGWAATTLLATRSASRSSASPPLVPAGGEAASGAAGGAPLLCLACALAGVPILMWVFSRLSTPIFNERYYFASGMAWPILLAAGAFALDRRAARLRHPLARQLPRLLQTAALLFLGGYFLNYTVGYEDPVAPALASPPDALTDANTHATRSLKELPIVVESPYTYLPRFYYNAQAHAPQPNREVYLLDWASATDPQATRSAANGYQIAAALKRQYPAFTIEDSAAFLARTNEFFILPADGFRWFANRIMNNPNFQTRLIATPNGQTFIYVVRAPAPAPATH